MKNDRTIRNVRNVLRSLNLEICNRKAITRCGPYRIRVPRIIREHRGVPEMTLRIITCCSGVNVCTTTAGAQTTQEVVKWQRRLTCVTALILFLSHCNPSTRMIRIILVTRIRVDWSRRNRSQSTTTDLGTIRCVSHNHTSVDLRCCVSNIGHHKTALSVSVRITRVRRRPRIWIRSWCPVMTTWITFRIAAHTRMNV